MQLMIQKMMVINFIIIGICAIPFAYGTSSLTTRYQMNAREKDTKIDQLTKELQKTKYQLQISNNELDTFAQTVSHDLKNPLTTLIGASYILKDPNYLAEQRTEAVQMILRTGQKMDNIIHELLVLSTLRKADNVKIKPLHMKQIISAIEKRLTVLPQYESSHISLPTSWPKTEGYTLWIEAVWVSYLLNALQRGGEAARIKIGATLLNETTAKFWVQDNGSMLIPEQQAHLFTTSEKLLDTKVEGFGVGLPVVHYIIQCLGGEVGIENNGKESMFYFTLPTTTN